MVKANSGYYRQEPGYRLLYCIIGPNPAKPMAGFETILSNLGQVGEALLVKFGSQFGYFLRSGNLFNLRIVSAEFTLQREFLCVKEPPNIFSFIQNLKK